ncbi:MAG: nucleotidyltransferase family protein [Rectinema subterraneum]|jgi:NDP-sugar pyrophosphorylase family protein
MKLLVLAAGIGSRFGGIKQLAPVGPNGETLLEYSLFDALRAGFSEIVFLVRPEIEEDFRTMVLSRLPASVQWQLAYQTSTSMLDEKSIVRARENGRIKPWGTGHALLCARAQLEQSGPFAVINADDFYGPRAFAGVQANLTANPQEFCFAGYRLDDVVPQEGVVSRAACTIDADGLLTGIVEHKRVWRRGQEFISEIDGKQYVLDPQTVVSMNLWGLSEAIFAWAERMWRDFLSEPANYESKEFFLPDIVNAMVAHGAVRMRMIAASMRSFGLTNPGDLEETRERIARMIAKGDYPAPLWRGK